MSQEMFYSCPKCKQWVNAKRSRCVCGLDRPIRPQLITYEEYTQLKGMNKSEETMEVEGIGPQKQCTGCGKVMNTYGGECPDCQGILIYVQDEHNGLPTEALRWAEDEEGDDNENCYKPLFMYTAVRYENGDAIYAQRIQLPIEEGGIVLGRLLFLKDIRLFYGHISEEIDMKYSNISRYNARLFQEGERLFVSYYQDQQKKSTIYINGKALKPDETRELEDGDIIRFGEKSITDQAIDVKIYCINARQKKETSVEQNFGANHLRDVMNMLGELKSGVNSLQSSMTNLQSGVDTINTAIGELTLLDVTIQKGEKPEQYEERLADKVPEVTEEVKLEYLRRFLLGELDENSNMYHWKLDFFSARKMRYHLLYQVQFYEDACIKNNIGDFAGPMSFMGKVAESFVMGETTDTLKYYEATTYAECTQTNGKWVTPDKILKAFRSNAVKRSILRKTGYGDDNVMYEKLCNAIIVFDEIRKARNEASHCDPDTGETLFDGQVKVIKRDQYMKIKKMFLTKEAFETVHALYMTIPKNQRK